MTAAPNPARKFPCLLVRSVPEPGEIEEVSAAGRRVDRQHVYRSDSALRPRFWRRTRRLHPATIRRDPLLHRPALLLGSGREWCRVVGKEPVWKSGKRSLKEEGWDRNWEMGAWRCWCWWKWIWVFGSGAGSLCSNSYNSAKMSPL
ncbi:hypothetical protein LINPERPRIM_LOCUS16754 [Linum perenne]